MALISSCISWKKHNVVTTNVVKNSKLCKMSHLMDVYLYLTLILLLLSKYLILVLLLHQAKEVQPPALCDRVEQVSSSIVVISQSNPPPDIKGQKRV